MPAKGAITIEDEKGNSTMDGSTANPYAHYVVISAGLDGKGAYALQGGMSMACNAAAGHRPEKLPAQQRHVHRFEQPLLRRWRQSFR